MSGLFDRSQILPSLVMCLVNDQWKFAVMSGLLDTPEGRPGMSDVSPLSGISGLLFDSTLLSPFLFFCQVLPLFLSCLFFWLLIHSPDIFFSGKFFNIFIKS